MKNPELQKIIDEIRSEVCEIMARDLLSCRPDDPDYGIFRKWKESMRSKLKFALKESNEETSNQNR